MIERALQLVAVRCDYQPDGADPCPSVILASRPAPDDEVLAFARDRAWATNPERCPKHRQAEVLSTSP